MNHRTQFGAALATLVLPAVLLAGCAVSAPVAAEGGAEREPSASPPASSSQPATPSSSTPAPASVDAQLRYLIEEEKLAHDVYVALGDLWGARIFDTIARSETTHEEAVARLLPTYGIDDPRTDEPGVFSDPTLQALYDELVAQGSRSLADAIQVGVTIETTDIADLSAALPTAPSDVAAVIERLLAASENHLAAFRRQE